MRYLTTVLLMLASFNVSALAQQPAVPADKPAPKPEDTEVWQPEPKVVTPGATCAAAPSDAIILFDGKNLDQWVSAGDKDRGSPAKWIVANGILTVDKAVGNIETKRSFKNYQLHVEWRVPENVTGSGQLRGNSGVFLASTGPGDAGYELQVLDNYNNKTYVNGQAGSIYKQAIPLANPNRKPGEWQTYDIAWTAPVFNADGTLKSARLRHGLLQRSAGRESLRTQRRNPLHRRALLQSVRRSPHQTPGPRRPQPAPQLPQHLGAAAGLTAPGGANVAQRFSAG